jgi:CRISPR-associated endoribonuclease Cas6
MPVTFEFFRFRFHFRALSPVRFPAGKAANTIRGALGIALGESASPAVFQTLFDPQGSPGSTPSGLAAPPRPFVIRAAHLDGSEVPTGTSFSWDIHAFDLRHPPVEPLRQAFAQLAETGIGPGRGRAALDRIEHLDLLDRSHAIPAGAMPQPLRLTLDGGPFRQRQAIASVHLRFLTPTELKGEGDIAERPEFPILFARLRDRISSLSAFYGRGPLAIDFRAMGDRARAIRLLDCNLEWSRTDRRSTRTGQVHPIGGFTGDAVYTGDLGEFLPWLEAARWTGVGRHTVWGQGDVRVIHT